MALTLHKRLFMIQPTQARDNRRTIKTTRRALREREASRFTMPFTHWSERRAASRDEDRLVVFGSGAHWTIVVADGAGGMSGGAAAATEAVVAAAACGSSTSRTAAEWCRFLVELDRELVGQVHTGETTVVVAEVVDGTVHGASVGDSGAWLVSSGEILDLTERQHRKPLVGSGSAHPVPFESRPLTGRLLVATDG